MRKQARLTVHDMFVFLGDHNLRSVNFMIRFEGRSVDAFSKSGSEMTMLTGVNG